MFRNPHTLFRALAIAEAISWTLLIAGLILRGATDWALGVTIGGGIHGFIFLSYGATVILVALNNRWRTWPTVPCYRCEGMRNGASWSSTTMPRHG